VCCWLVAGDSHYTTAHRQAAAWPSLLVIVALGVAAHVVVLAYQFRPGANNRPVRLEAGADSGQTLRFRRRGLKAALIGADGRASTSKAQVVLWTAAVIAGLADLLLLTRSFPGGTLFTDAVTKNWHPEYLVLLGLPVAAAIVAKAAVSASNNGQGPVTRATALRLADAKHTAATQNPPQDVGPVAAALVGAPAALALVLPPTRVYTREPVEPGICGIVQAIGELLTSDSGEVAWPDMQYVAFTLITLISFAAQLLANPAAGLPPVPAALLTLMGVSASGYTASKALETRGVNVAPAS
jgi:hypothetical protein